MGLRKSLCVVVIASVIALSACSAQPSIPEDTSQEMYEIGCDALEQIDAALDANDLFSDDLKTQLQTLSVEARNVENQQENDAEILDGIQGAAISIALDNGDDAMDYIDQLREALGKTE